MKIRSLRWRIATWYALLLIAVITGIGSVLTLELRGIVLDQARAGVDRVGSDIARVATQSGPLGAVGEALPMDQELVLPGNLEHWSSPNTFIEVDSARGYPLGKTSNMGAATFGSQAAPPAGEPAYATENTSLGEVLVRTERLRFAGGNELVIKVGERLDIFYATLQRMRELLTVVVIAAGFAVAFGSIVIAAGAIRPIQQLTSAIGEIRPDQLNRRIGWVKRDDEVGLLAMTFDAMLARLESAFARERQFISDASHELKTPLTVIHANAQLLERWGDRDPDVRRESIRAIIEESAALGRMVAGMLTLAKAESGDNVTREEIALAGIVEEAVRASRPRAVEKSIDLQLETSTQTPLVLGNANLLRQLFGNLIDNAIKFTERGGVAVRVASGDGAATVAVSDTGIGIDETVLERVFDRFFRTDEARGIEGTGLGLAIARSITRIHGGTIEAGPAPGGGSVFTVTLPLFGTGSSWTHDRKAIERVS